MRRAFYHFHCRQQTPEAWSHQGEPEHRFELRWHSLDTPPELVAGQAEWLREFVDRLRDSDCRR